MSEEPTSPGEFPERLGPVLEATAPVAERFEVAGKRLYLVGGPVRDVIAGRPGGGEPSPEADIDLTTDATPDEIELLVGDLAEAVWTQGRRFGTIGFLRAGRRFEITTHRAEAYAPESRKPEVRFGNDIETDLSRRDFTVNAMALSLPELKLVDPFDGIGDIAARRLRTPLDPEVAFSDDPLRMLRAARFIAGYELEPDAALVKAVETERSRLEIVSRERIRDELDKLLLLPVPTEGLWFIVRTGLAEEFLPELPALALEQDPIQRHKDVLAHTIAVVEKTSPDRTLRLAALFHDVGKPLTRAYRPRWGPLPPPRRGRSEDGAKTHARAAVPDRCHRRRRAARGAASALPYLQDGLDRLGPAPIRARRRGPARSFERADPLRLHDPQPGQGPRTRAADGRARGTPGGACASARNSTRFARSSTASRS